MSRFRKFVAESTGASVVEYALVLGLVVAGVATALPMLGGRISDSVSASATAAASSPAAPVAVSNNGNNGNNSNNGNNGSTTGGDTTGGDTTGGDTSGSDGPGNSGKPKKKDK